MKLTETLATADVTGGIVTFWGILFLLLIPGSFVGAYYSLRKFVRDKLLLGLLTLLLGGVYLIAGTCAIMAGCTVTANLAG